MRLSFSITSLTPRLSALAVALASFCSGQVDLQDFESIKSKGEISANVLQTFKDSLRQSLGQVDTSKPIYGEKVVADEPSCAGRYMGCHRTLFVKRDILKRSTAINIDYDVVGEGEPLSNGNSESQPYSVTTGRIDTQSVVKGWTYTVKAGFKVHDQSLEVTSQYKDETTDSVAITGGTIFKEECPSHTTCKYVTLLFKAEIKGRCITLPRHICGENYDSCVAGNLYNWGIPHFKPCEQYLDWYINQCTYDREEEHDCTVYIPLTYSNGKPIHTTVAINKAHSA
ncbi:hypothetical protein CDD82_5058 [Ophiocordyceps australis]|uniref:Uncharacterized protein n=1 Tax=Ophiocordyceps australis TaxID=1399860 RepID=A0A2C5Y7Y0_9HYPO|nr:hypothetical protein CDD82_5058 [Ophiocordyceps australis]